MRIVRIPISEELLRDMLCLPKNAKIVSAHKSPSRLGVIELIVESNELPEVESGNAIPERAIVLEWKSDERPSQFLNFEWGAN